MLLTFVVLLLTTDPAPVETAPTAKAATVQVHVLVTDRNGSPLPSAHVVVKGVSEREGHTDGAGRVSFQNVREGSYELTVDRRAFITFQKDFAVDAGRESVAVSAALSPEPTPAAGRR